MISLKEYIMGRDKISPLDVKLISNAAELLCRVNFLFGKLNLNTEISSGYRPVSINESVGGSKMSSHIECKGIDILDPFGKIGTLLSARQDLLTAYELFMENPKFTSKVIDGKVIHWVHLQTRETKARIFNPY